MTYEFVVEVAFWAIVGIVLLIAVGFLIAAALSSHLLRRFAPGGEPVSEGAEEFLRALSFPIQPTFTQPTFTDGRKPEDHSPTP